MQAGVAKTFLEAGMMEICEGEIIVNAPLIYVKDGQNERGDIVLFWNSSTGNQCEFKLNISLKGLRSMCHLDPEFFQAVFVGQMRSIPRNALLRKRIEKHYVCVEDDWVLLAAAPFKSGRKSGSRKLPAHFVTKIAPVMVAGEIVKPVGYKNEKVWRSAEGMINPSVPKVAPRRMDIYSNKGILQ